MWPTSARWDEQLRGAYEPTARAEVYHDGSYVMDLALTGGDVRVSEGSRVRRQVSLTSADVDLSPEDLYDLLAPDDTDLWVWAGVRYADGDEELVPVGWYRVSSLRRPSVYGPVEVDASDYSAVMAGARFLRPWSTPANRSIVDEIALMVHDVDPTIEVIDATDMYPVPRTRSAVWERDRWDAIEAIASGAGCEAYFDPARRLIVRPVPEVTTDTAPVWACDAGTETAVMLDLGQGWEDAGYNAVVASSSAAGTSAPVTAIAYASSWRAGVKRPRFASSPMVTTTAEALRLARAILVRSAAWQRSLSPVAAPNWALDVGDPIAVTTLDGATETRIVTDLTIPLGQGTMPISTRVAVDALAAYSATEL